MTFCNIAERASDTGRLGDPLCVFKFCSRGIDGGLIIQQLKRPECIFVPAACTRSGQRRLQKPSPRHSTFCPPLFFISCSCRTPIYPRPLDNQTRFREWVGNHITTLPYFGSHHRIYMVPWGGLRKGAVRQFSRGGIESPPIALMLHIQWPVHREVNGNVRTPKEVTHRLTFSTPRSRSVPGISYQKLQHSEVVNEGVADRARGEL